MAEASDVLEERLIETEYKIWKKNTPFLYEYVMTHALEWPSLTCEWTPTPGRTLPYGYEHSLLLGTHTTDGEQNYLMTATCVLPKETETDEQNPRYDEEKKEVGGFGHAHSAVGKVEIKMKVKHEGEVNRARHMPQNHFVVASRGPDTPVYIFDLTKHTSVPNKDAPFCPQGVCVGHEKEGYAMVWSSHDEGLLCTGAEDGVVKLWNVNTCLLKGASSGTQIPATTTLKGHSGPVEDVDWHYFDKSMIASVGDDSALHIWDTRKDSPTITFQNAHVGDINCVSFNPKQEYVVATAGADKDIGVWDIRKPKERLFTLVGHMDQVYQLQWSPFDESILGSCAADRRMAVWDLSRVGQEQDPEDAEDGPPELLFLHGGHTSKVSDFCWNPNLDWVVASVSDDNNIQMWQMCEDIYADGEDDDQGEEEGGLKDDELE